MPAVEIKDLFHTNRFPRGLSLLPVLLYFPLGLCLTVLRFFIGAHMFLISCVLPKTWMVRRFVLRVMCIVMGIIVTQDGVASSSVKCMVANNICILDHLAVELIVPHIMPSVYDLPSTMNWLLGYVEMGVKQGRQCLIDQASQHCQESSIPIFAHPEGASTSGKKGLLKFSTWPFSLGVPVLPILVHVTRPSLINIKPSILGGRWWVDVFWFMFVPFTQFHLKFLPMIDRQENEEVSDFTKRVQGLMSTELGVVSTVYTSADKVEYAKRIMFTNNRITRDDGQGPTTTPAAPSPSRMTRLDSMAQQVQAVLPQVPLHVIKADLGQTSDVDITITNILEGRVKYSPVKFGQDSPPPVVVQPSAATPKKSNCAAKSFAKSSAERMKSFKERKAEMMESARKRYMAKHGLS